MSTVVNIVGLKAGWLACIIGAANDVAWVGPVVVALHLAWHLSTSPSRTGQARLLVLAALVGLVVDTALARGGWLAYASALPLAWISPPWMVALWLNFATALTRSMSFLLDRVWIAGPLGAIGGPLAYWGGAELGAVALTRPSTLVAVGVAWALSLPLLAWLAARPIVVAAAERETA